MGRGLMKVGPPVVRREREMLDVLALADAPDPVREALAIGSLRGAGVRAATSHDVGDLSAPHKGGKPRNEGSNEQHARRGP